MPQVTKEEYQRANVKKVIQEAIFDHGWIIGSVEGIDDYVFYGLADEYALTTLLNEMVAEGKLVPANGGFYRLPDLERFAIKKARFLEFIADTDFADDLKFIHEATANS